MSQECGDRSSEGRTGEQRVGDSGVVEERPTYDPTTDAYLTRFSPTDTAASIAVVAALTDIRHCSTADLDPLYDLVDTDALDALVAASAPSLEVRFSVDGFGVLVTGGGRLEVTPPE